MQSTQLITPELSYFDTRDCYMLNGRNAICGAFVRVLLDLPHFPISQMPQKIRLAVSLEEDPDALKINVWEGVVDNIICWQWTSKAPGLAEMSTSDSTLHEQVDDWFEENEIKDCQALWIKVAD